ncbi:MAG: T9SS type A sorting domain-containing protein [Bacteroidales bacterium]|nr:T9SS type A sorting domain-containing protein [Bacteroidales bacterium]
MRKFIFLLASLFVYLAQAQDTTALRFIAITAWDSEDVIFFKNDTTDLYGVVSDIHGNDFTGHALFVNPNDELLYAVVDSANDYGTTTRAIYKLNPLTGQFTGVMDLADWTASATITPDGRVFAIEGNNDPNPGQINEIDLVNLTKTPVAQSNIPDGYSRGMLYNSNDSSLYIYSAGLDSVFIMKVDDWTETQFLADFPSSYVKGGFYRDNQFWIASEDGLFYHVNLADSLTGPSVGSSSHSLMDATEFRMLAGPTQIQLFPGSSSPVLRSLYGTSAFQWYRNDTLITGATADTLVVSSPGNYKLLAEIDTSGNFIWSEDIQVTAPAITDLRFIAIGMYGYDIDYFKNDTSDMLSVNATVDVNNGFTGHALFVNPADGLLYGVADPDNDFSSTTRKVYKINPLTGQFDLVMDLGNWTASAEITPEGRLFTIEGNGGTTPGEINEIDLVNLTQTQVAVSNVPSGEPRAMVYNPQDSSLYIYSSYIDSVFIMKVDAWTETQQYAYTYQEVHGGYYRDNQFWLASYYGEINHVNLSDSLGGEVLLTSGYNFMDVTEFDLLNEDQNIGVCANVPMDVVLHAKYPSTAYLWYRNDTLISGANADSLVIPDYGDYKLLTEIDTSGSYIWSEMVNIHSLNVPNVSISASDTLWCPGDTIQLSGSAGGTSQWYMDGVAIAGADSNVYFAIYVGYYNMTKTNLNGCTDSASVGITIVDDPGCPNSVEEEMLANTVSVYPTPFTNTINISLSGNEIQKVIVTDIKGSVLSEKEVNGNFTTVDASQFKVGIYFLKIITDDGVVVKQIVKQ